MRHRFIQNLYGCSFDSPASIRSHVDIGSGRCEADSWADGYCVERERATIFARTRNGVGCLCWSDSSSRTPLRACLCPVPVRHYLETWACVGM